MLLLFPPAPPLKMMYRKKPSTTVTETITRISCALVEIWTPKYSRQKRAAQ